MSSHKLKLMLQQRFWSEKVAVSVLMVFAQSITSIKSMDLGCKTYQRGSAIFSKLASYVDKVANFTTSTMSGLTVSANNSTQRILELAIPSGANPEQMKAIQDATTYAMQKGVEVIVHVIE